MSDSERGNRMLVKSVVLLIVFPVLASVIHILLFPVLLLFSPIVSRFGNWSERVANVISIASLVFAVVGAAMITRLIWPKRDSHRDASCAGPDVS